MHGRFFENFIKSWKISLVTYKNMKNVPIRVQQCFLKYHIVIGEYIFFRGKDANAALKIT